MVKAATDKENIVTSLKKEANDIPRSKRPNGKVHKLGQSKKYVNFILAFIQSYHLNFILKVFGSYNA